MSVLSVLFYTVHGTALRRAYIKRPASDATYLELFSRILMGQGENPSMFSGCGDARLESMYVEVLTRIVAKLSTALERAVNAEWDDVYDLVNPFGDCRGGAIRSVWTLDFDQDLIFLTQENRHGSAPLELARERLLSQDDFEPVSSAEPERLQDNILPGPYWMPDLDQISRERSFSGRILRDFAYTWRHVIRREMNTFTFMKLTYAIVWILRMEYTLLERTGFEHVSEGGPYVKVVGLPNWNTPESNLVPVGSSWFVLAQDIRQGLEMVRRHARRPSSSGCFPSNKAIYAILTLRQLVVCKALGNELTWTKPEKLFDGSSPSENAIDLLIWAITTSRIKHSPTTIQLLPLEIQDKILCHATGSLVAAGKLGCELGLGSPFSWTDRGVAIRIAEFKRHRSESSPVEAQIIFDGVRSGLSYKRAQGYPTIHSK